MDIEQKINEVRERIRRACEKAGRDPSSVSLMLVTKFIDPALIREAYDCGMRLFGENRVQELAEKIDLLPKDIRWHMIGRLQTNKVKYIAGRVECIQSLDRIELAREIESQAAKKGVAEVPCLIEINSSGEPQKGGLAAEQAGEFLAALKPGGPIRIKGLMTVGPMTDSEKAVREAFRKMKRLQEELKARHPGHSWDLLSMGMSNDFETAVEEGSTMVRVGSLVFGPRQH